VASPSPSPKKRDSSRTRVQVLDSSTTSLMATEIIIIITIDSLVMPCNQLVHYIWQYIRTLLFSSDIAQMARSMPAEMLEKQ